MTKITHQRTETDISQAKIGFKNLGTWQWNSGEWLDSSPLVALRYEAMLEISCQSPPTIPCLRLFWVWCLQISSCQKQHSHKHMLLQMIPREQILCTWLTCSNCKGKKKHSHEREVLAPKQILHIPLLQLWEPGTYFFKRIQVIQKCEFIKKYPGCSKNGRLSTKQKLHKWTSKDINIRGFYS